MAFAADFSSISYQQNGLTGRYDDQFDVAAFRLKFHFLITGKRPYAPVPITSRWHFQGIFSSMDKGGMPELVTKFLGRHLLAFADFSAVDHHVLLVRAAVDSEGTEGKFVEVHTLLLVLLCSGALLRGDGGEGGPALLDLVTAAVRAGSPSRVMLCDGQNLREYLLAGVAYELIVGHINLPQPLSGYGWILDPWLEIR
jgi:hypothetical protein